jgi:hypothetical protein
MPIGLLATLLPALFPPVLDAAKSLIGKWTGSSGYDPTTVDDAVKLMAAQAQHAEALAKLDAPSGSASLWVVNLRESSRYIAVWTIFAGTGLAIAANANPVYVDALLQMSASAFSFLFGDRIYLHIKGGDKR